MRSYQSDRGRRGAALIVAIAIMTILLAIALTFFAVTRIELRTATNVTNTVRVEFLAEAGVAMAVATLNQDFLAHPGATSLDHPWRSIYSGTAFAGKRWAWRNGVPLTSKGVPEVNLNLFPYVDVDGDGFVDEPLYRGPRTRDWLFIPRVENAGAPFGKPFSPTLYSSNAALYSANDDPVNLTSPGDTLPQLANYQFFRYDPDAAEDASIETVSPEEVPFATPAVYGPPTVPGLPQSVFDADPDGQFYTKEMVDMWADVDNDGDGLKDSIWIPVPIDQFFSGDGMDNDLDGLIDEQQDNGVDEDSDGFIEGLDTDGDGVADSDFDPDEAIEAAPFVYYAGDDGLDNDGDGFIDREDCPGCSKTFRDGTTREAQPPFEYDPVYDPIDPPRNPVSPSVAESKLGFMLAAPLPGMRIKIDVDANGIVGDANDVYYDEVTVPGGDIEYRAFPAEITLPASFTVNLHLVGGAVVPLEFTAADVDTIDNDYDLLVNNFNVYAYLLDWEQPEWRPVNHWDHSLRVCERECERRGLAEGLTPAEIQECKDACVLEHLPWIAQGFDPFLAKEWLESQARQRAFRLSYNEINTGIYFPGLYEDNQFPDTPQAALDQNLENQDTTYRLRITMTGEPVCTLAGRAAVLVADEQSKVNLNAAGAQTYDIFAGAGTYDAAASGVGTEALYRALGDGITPYEYETRALPAIGTVLSRHMWQLMTGAPDGRGLGNGAGDPGSDTEPQGTAPIASYHYDVSLPGYGRVDDNGNALLLALNGLNDNAARDLPENFDQGISDEGLRLPRLSDHALSYLEAAGIGQADLPPEVRTELQGGFRSYTLRLGLLEGIDEPAEMQRFRPLRNELAERDIDADGAGPLDNDGNGIANELGELGDRNLRTREQITEVAQIGDGTFAVLKNIISVHAADKNLKYYSTLSGVKTLPKVDLNYAPPQQIAAAMLLQNTLGSPLSRTMENPADPGRQIFYVGEVALSTDSAERRDKAGLDAEARAFAGGLLQADTDVLAPPLGGGSGGGLLFTELLSPSTRIELDHRIPADPVLGALQAAVDIVDSRDRDHARSVLSTERADIASPRDRVSNDDLISLEEIQEYMAGDLELANPPRLERVDEWWNNVITAPDERLISYTVSGTEAIRINELMARPVRRVEAEATPDRANFGTAYSVLLDPTPFTEYLDGFTAPDGTEMISELPEFIMQRRTVIDVPSGSDFVGGWGPSTSSSNVLGDGAVWANELQYATDSNGSILPDAIEYLFVASDGLPEGRYYLTANVIDPADGMSIIQDGQLLYSVKYVPVEYVAGANGRIDLLAPTILEDLLSIAANSMAPGPTDPDDLKLGWWEAWQETGQPGDTGVLPPLFSRVTQSEMALGDAQAARRPEGWVFLDGSKVPAVDPNPVFPGYFERGLDTSTDPRMLALAPPYDASTGTLFWETNTVLVPPPPLPERIDPVTGNTLAPEPGWALCVALMKDLDAANADTTLAVNFFDFSQEPDHEWVELLNVSDEPVDIGGWQVEVGVPSAFGVVPDPNPFASPILWEIPAGTVIAPQGTVLLTPSKFDEFQVLDCRAIADRTLISRNGLGLARGVMPFAEFIDPDPCNWQSPYDFVAVTVPPMADLAPLYGTLYPDLTNYADASGSVFDRLGAAGFDLYLQDVNKFAALLVYRTQLAAYINDPATAPFPVTPPEALEFQVGPYGFDYVDTNGDGLNDAIQNPLNRDAAIETTPNDGLGLATTSWRDKAWDRIVQVTVSGVDLDTRENMIQLVLQGGMLPNYPEHDGIDNDGDGPYFTTANQAVPEFGALATDGVDNDLDGFIDELDEGVDEGRSVMAGSYGQGDYGTGTIPVSFFNAGSAAYDVAISLSGDAGIDAQLGSTADSAGVITRMGFDIAAYEPGDLGGPPKPYLGTDVDVDTGQALDPPAWKAFVQRRWYPGDNVIVTLYEGEASQGRVADRITYNELDIVNRSIDDVRFNPYAFDEDGVFTGAETLNPNYPTLWQPNHMGLDFYKSLERKHPLYNGDKFGTRNRWEATDGNYDDWADSLLPWQRVLEKDEWPPLVPSQTAISTPDAHLYRFDPRLPVQLAGDERLLRHAMSASPLRYNYTHRVSINPELNNASDSQFPLAWGFPIPWGGTGLKDSVLLPNPDWGLLEAQVRGGDAGSTGDLLRLPHPTFEVALFNTLDARYPSDFAFLDYGSNVNIVSRYEDVQSVTLHHEDRTLRTGVLGQALPGSGTEAVLAQATGTAAFSPIVLTMAQAQFTAIGPAPDVLEDEDLTPQDILDDGGDPAGWYQWKTGGDTPQAPRGWAPVYLFRNPGDETQLPPYRYVPLNGGEAVPLTQWPYLLNSVFFTHNNARWTDPLTQYSAAHYGERWPLEKRIIGFISDRHDPHPAPDVDILGDLNDPAVVDEIRSAPEALFEWGPEDGLENGDYVVYIGTFIPDLRETLERTDESVKILTQAYANNQTNLLEKLLGPGNTAATPNWLGRMTGASPAFPATIYGDTIDAVAGSLDLFVGRSLPDAALDDIQLSQATRSLALQVEVMTDRIRAGRELTSPLNWGRSADATGNPVEELRPCPDGYMLYAYDNQSNWRPRVVQVRDNYLAIRVRNVSPPGQPVFVTHVVLAPRRNTPGRINVNTADMNMHKSPAGNPSNQELFNPLMGLPGMIDAATGVPRDHNVSLPNLDYDPDALGSAWLSPTQIASENQSPLAALDQGPRLVPPGRTNVTIDDEDFQVLTELDDRGDLRSAALQLSAMIAEGRTEHADGRYYENPVQLAGSSSAYLHPDPPAARLYGYIYPLSNEDDPQIRFQQMSERFRRMANLLTTRSDLYEIIVTAQSGYGLDMDGDGFINYRSNDEFVTTAESKVRAVYERRSPRPDPVSPQQAVP